MNTSTEQMNEMRRAITDDALVKLYKESFPGVAGYVKKYGGNLFDAKDIFHDALILYQEKMGDEAFALRNKPGAYIMGIAKHLWHRKSAQQQKFRLTGVEETLDIPVDFYPSVNQKRLLRFLEAAGKRCLDLLRAFYYRNISADEIAREMGYSNAHTASARKYTCLEKVRAAIHEKSLQYEDFME